MLPFEGIWNERPWGTPDWVKQYRAAMDEAGFLGTKIVIPDGKTSYSAPVQVLQYALCLLTSHSGWSFTIL